MYIKYLLILVCCIIAFNGNGQNPITANQYVSTGDRALNQGEVKIAEEAYKQALLEYEEAGDAYAQSLVMEKIKKLLFSQKRYQEALPFAMGVCDFRSKNTHYEISDKLYDYGMLSIILGNLNNREDAISCLELVRLASDILNSSFSRGYYYMTAGQTYSGLKNWDLASENYKKSEIEFSDCDSEECCVLKKYIFPLSAAAYYQAGLIEDSYNAYKDWSVVCVEQYGERSREYADALIKLANIEGYYGLLDKASEHYIKGYEIIRQIVSQDLELLPSNDRGSCWSDVNEVMWNMIPFALAANYNQDEFTKSAFDAIMFYKGLLLSLETSTKSIIENSGDDTLVHDYSKIEKLRGKISQLKALHEGLKATQIYAEMDSLDNVLAKRLSVLGFKSVMPRGTYDEVVSHLEDDEVIVDFADFVKHDGTHVYAALVAKHGMTHPKLIKVFEQTQLDSLLKINNGYHSNLYKDKNQRRMYEIVWQPLIDEIGNVKTIYFVPSGILNQIAVEAIKLPEGLYIGDRFDLVRLSNSREVIGYNDNSHISNFAEARLYGDLEYDINPEEMARNASEYDVHPLLAVRGTSGLKANEGFKKLKMSEAEVIGIDEILTHSKINTKKFMNTLGTEESFVSMSGKSPDLLLLSTHGFYYSPDNVPSWSSLNGYDNPMYLTGLVMSGGNAEYLKREIPDGVMGGLLTSSDIARLDLSGTQLVVLSACETGLGDTTNEGVYGLQRAFKKAGAQTLVMSLWPVSDLATKDFMILFHKELAANKWDKRAAFKNAKKALRITYNDPYYWAAFIMVD